MGYTQASEMNEWADRKTALSWHLQSNHFPPVHLDFLPVAEWAIDLHERYAAGIDDDFQHETITMPNGIVKSAPEVIDGLHLWPFLSYGDESDGEYFDNDF
jgi:hypothetical protein